MLSSYYHGASLKLTYSFNKTWKLNVASYLELSSISKFPRPGSQVCSNAYMDAPFWLVRNSQLPHLSYPSLLMIINKRVHVYFIVNSYCVTQVINSLARPVVTTLTKRDKSEHARALLSLAKLSRQLLARLKMSTCSSYKRSPKLPRLGGWPSYPGQRFFL